MYTQKTIFLSFIFCVLQLSAMEAGGEIASLLEIGNLFSSGSQEIIVIAPDVMSNLFIGVAETALSMKQSNVTSDIMKHASITFYAAGKEAYKQMTHELSKSYTPLTQLSITELLNDSRVAEVTKAVVFDSTNVVNQFGGYIGSIAKKATEIVYLPIEVAYVLGYGATHGHAK